MNIWTITLVILAALALIIAAYNTPKEEDEEHECPECGRYWFADADAKCPGCGK